MEVYNYEKENKYAAARPQKREVTREDLEARYAIEHPAEHQLNRDIKETILFGEPLQQRGLKAWVWKHAPMLAGTIAVAMGLLSLGLWVIGIEMLIPLLAMLLIYAGFLAAMMVLNYEKE